MADPHAGGRRPPAGDPPARRLPPFLDTAAERTAAPTGAEAPSSFRDNAGVFTAMIVVFAFVAIGFFKMVTDIGSGQKLEIPPDWLAAMLSLASAAMGYLIGRKSSQPGVGGYSQEDYDRALDAPLRKPLPPGAPCPTCGASHADGGGVAYGSDRPPVTPPRRRGLPIGDDMP